MVWPELRSPAGSPGEGHSPGQPKAGNGARTSPACRTFFAGGGDLSSFEQNLFKN